MRKKRRDWLISLAAVAFILVGLYALCYIYVAYNYNSISGEHSHGKFILDFGDSNSRTSLRLKAAEGSSQHEQLSSQPDAECIRLKIKQECPVLDIAMVVAGYSAIRRMIPLLKSLLFYRSTPLRFHFIVFGSVSSRIIETLMVSWNLGGVEWYTYDAQEVINDVAWIPNKHYSGVYGLLKLILPKILPQNLHKVLVLDNDLLFNADVYELWKYFNMLDKNNGTYLLGLAENLSPWYLGTMPIKYNPWPALDRGFNTGVILMDLKKMRALDWHSFWMNVANSTLASHGPLGLADQDIFNAIIKRDTALVYKLPCRWNFQIGKSFSYNYCRKPLKNVKIIHFNSAFKSGDYVDPTADYFRKRYRSFLEMNHLFGRWESSVCANNATGLIENATPIDNNSFEEDPCSEFEVKLVHRTHLYYKDFSYEPLPIDITLVAQLSFDRLHMLEPLLARWSGPASLAVYLTDWEAAQFHDFIESQTLSARLNVVIHVVYRHGKFYPVNKLRNIALKEVNTSHVFLSDIDFIPSANLYEDLLSFLHAEGNTSKKAFVVPAFESRVIDMTPSNKSSLLEYLASGQAQIFRQQEWSRGHSATNYSSWMAANQSYEVNYETDYEPYVVAQLSGLPFYDERFIGFGWNKVSHIMELDAAGFKFIVFPYVYLIHQPHPPSLDIKKFRSNAIYRRCLKLLKGQFIKELVRKYSQH